MPTTVIQEKHTPLLGVNTAGCYLWRSAQYGKKEWTYSVYAEAIKELGADYLDEVDDHLEFFTGGDYQHNRKKTISQLESYFAFLQKNNLKFVWNLNRHAWFECLEVEPGKNFYEPEPGTHYTKVPQDILDVCSRSGLMVGVNYDELEHGQLSASAWASCDEQGNPTAELPALGDTTGMSYEQAYDHFYGKAVEISDYYKKRGMLCSVELVWPDTHHIFARAGWTLSPKLLKESWNPLVIAMGLGAAIQYEHKGAGLWFTPDLWGREKYPGHSVAALKSALMTAQWMGVDRIYVENLDYVYPRQTINDAGLDYLNVEKGPHHPDAEGQFGSLVGFISDKEYKLTRYGEVVKWYSKEYRKKHPTPFRWVDARCKIAIVRFPDTCWGARGSYFRDRLFGARDLSSTSVTEEWFKIWHILSLETIPATGISFYSKDGEKLTPRFFCPMPSVLVFDHRIGDEHPDFDFRGAKIIFLTGVNVTDSTRKLISERVSGGVICIVSAHLASNDILSVYEKRGAKTCSIPFGRGKWIVTNDMSDTFVKDAVSEYLPNPDEMHFEFGEHVIVVRRIGTDNDSVEIFMDGRLQ